MSEFGPAQPFSLTEFEPSLVSLASLAHEAGELLWREHGHQIDVEFPSPRTGGQWRLTNRGWVGLIPVGAQRLLSLQPKLPLGNVFRMLEYAYRMDAFRTADKVVGAGSMQEVYESLARVLARRVRDRARKGLHRSYVERDELLPVVRGRIDLAATGRSGADPRLRCHFDEHTIDHADNQILLRALEVVLRSGLCRETSRREVREAHRALRGAVTPVDFAARELRRRAYDRLNHDYCGMHALAYFFLAHTGPTHRPGEASMTPFLVDMAQLFEKFVAAWLRVHLPPNLQLQEQETGSYDLQHQIGYRIDMVLYDTERQPLAVLDTKYKRDPVPSAADVAQVVSYATRKGCCEALLVYPWTVGSGVSFDVGTIRVRSLGFDLESDPAAAGAAFLGALLGQHVATAPHELRSPLLHEVDQPT